MSEESVRETPTQNIIENELNTGIVIAGAYADKLRRTLFAQLREYVKKNKDTAREIARASGEVNRLLYIILIENLKCEKGDAVRVRIKYRYDPAQNRVTWDYDTLKIEYFKRIPDEDVEKVVKKIMSEKLEEIKKQYMTAPSREEAEKILRGEAVEEWREETKPLEKEGEDIVQNIGSTDPIGETMHGGVVFKLVSKSGDNIGIASIEPLAGEWIVDAIVIYRGKAYRIRGKLAESKDKYLQQPMKLVEEISRHKPLPISEEDARKTIEGKMGELV